MIGHVLAGGGGIAPVLANYAPRGFFDHFDAATLGADWTVRLGTWALASSKATAATLAADGNNLVSNGEFTTDTAGWTAQRDAALARVDAIAIGIAPTGGADNWALRVTQGSMTYGYGVQSITPMVGATYILSARVRSPSSNTSVKQASLYTYIAPGTVYYAVTVEDVWQTLSRTGAPATAGAMNIGGSMAMGAAGDVGYFDNFCIHQHRSLATVTRGNANATAQAGIVMPASGVVPFGIVARYQDLANYWAWEIIPGTAGNDFQLVRMQAGVRTVLAAADIDWVAETAYTLKFTHVGNVYTGYVNDVARLSYTDGASFLATETAFGIIEGKTSNGGFDWFQLN